MEVGLVGAGNMATALARGWGDPVLVHDADRSRAEVLVEGLGGEVVGSNADLAERADVIVLCHKPAQLEAVARETQDRARAVVSILAATPVERVEAAYPDRPVYRFMPNIPVEVRAGVLLYAPGSRAPEGPEEEILERFGRLGTVIPLDEPLIEVGMALMSCGPAFLALIAEALVDAGVRHGLQPDEAGRMVVETMGGTAAVLRSAGDDAAGLRRRVTSPGGSTARGLAALERGGARAALGDAVDAVVGTSR